MSQSRVKQLKSLLYTLIVFFFCIADQRRGSAAGEIQFIFVNLVGIGICLLMFFSYRWQDFVKLPYLVWTIVWVIAAAAITSFRGEEIQYQGQWYTALINVWLMGLLAIRLFIRFVTEKQSLPCSKRGFVLFAVFMLLACLSKNDSFWPWWYFALFAMLYLTELTAEDRRLLQNALLNGIILSFFVIQGLAFMFRPYDVLRYMGLYANPNINALYYSLVYCAFLGKYCSYFGRDKEAKGYRILRLVNLMFAGAMWSFVCFTICRSAMLGMALETLCAGIYCLCKAQTQILRNAVKMTAGLLLCILICAPVSYCAVRYLPPLFHHPIWFDKEYSPNKVHSWDPIDSPKYITWEQVVEGLFGRLSDVDLSKLFSEETPREPIYVASLHTDTMMAGLLMTQTPVLDADSVNSVSIRLEIFRYYLEHLNLWGHENAEHGLQLTENYWAPHAHNLFLQMAFNFGIIAGLFFFVWVLYGMLVLMRRAFRGEKDAGSVSLLLFYVNILTFGMLEIVWLTGQLSFTLLFLLPWLVFTDER